MKSIQLSYSQLRQILAIAICNEHIRTKLADVLAGKVEVTELVLIQAIADSGADLELIRIISGQDPETMDAMEATEWILSFFEYIRASLPKLMPWLESMGLKAKPTPTASNSLS